MEVYFKNLTSDESPTEKLVEDLMMLVHDAEDLVKATVTHLPENSKEEIKTTLERIKARAEKLKGHTLASVRATDQMIRQHPHVSVGAAFSLGLLIALLIRRK